jgi:hypothetical protein
VNGRLAEIALGRSNLETVQGLDDATLRRLDALVGL